MMKKCSKCQRNKDGNAFAKNRRKQDGKQDHCRACKKKVDRNYYLSGKKAQYKRVSTYKEDNARRVFQHLAQNPCVDCGEADPVILEFDHIHGKKLKALSVMVAHGYGWDKIQEEINKCVVRCANCHRRKTSKERGSFRWLEQIRIRESNQ